MSAERECDLRGALDRLERELAESKERLRTEAWDDYSAIKELMKERALWRECAEALAFDLRNEANPHKLGLRCFDALKAMEGTA